MSGWAWPESLYVSGCWSMGVYKYTSCLCDVCVCVRVRVCVVGCRDGLGMAHNAVNSDILPDTYHGSEPMRTRKEQWKIVSGMEKGMRVGSGQPLTDCEERE